MTDLKKLTDYTNSLSNDFQLNSIITLAGRALENEWKKFAQQSLEDIHKSIDLNLLGHINVIHSFLPFLKKCTTDKSILMISSINASEGFGLPAYSSSKSGLYGFVNSMTQEFGNDGIRINTVSPGTVVTPATQTEPKNFDSLLKGTALGKFTTSEDVAKLVYEICNSFVSLTGQNIVLDAGQSLIHLQ